MSADVDTVKVIIATVMPSKDGRSTELFMTTPDGVEIRFDLDDLAVAMIGLTYQTALLKVKDRRDAGQQPTIHPRPKDQK